MFATKEEILTALHTTGETARAVRNLTSALIDAGNLSPEAFHILWEHGAAADAAYKAAQDDARAFAYPPTGSFAAAVEQQRAGLSKLAAA